MKKSILLTFFCLFFLAKNSVGEAPMKSFDYEKIMAIEVVEDSEVCTIVKITDEHGISIFHVIAGVATAFLPDAIEGICKRTIGNEDVCNAVYAVTTGLVEFRGPRIFKGISGGLKWIANRGRVKSTATVSTTSYELASAVHTVFKEYKSRCSKGAGIPYEKIEINDIASCGMYGKYSFASTKYLNSTDLRRYTKYELSIMRNEIFARHGYKFHVNSKIINYFENQSWYHRVPYISEDSEYIFRSQLSDVERSNVLLIKEIEREK